MNIEVNKVVTLGNKEKYLVVSHVVSDGDYYYIAEVDENGKDIKDNYKIVKEVHDGDKVLFDEVVGEVNLKGVLPLFVKSIS